MVAIVPFWSLPAAPVVEEVPEKLKQYKVPTVKSPLIKVTALPETLEAVAPMPGQTVAPEGISLTLVLQLLALAETLKLSGKVRTTLASVPLVKG